MRLEGSNWSYPLQILREDTISLVLRMNDRTLKFLRTEIRGYEEGTRFVVVFRLGSTDGPIRYCFANFWYIVHLKNVSNTLFWTHTWTHFLSKIEHYFAHWLEMRHEESLYRMSTYHLIGRIHGVELASEPKMVLELILDILDHHHIIHVPNPIVLGCEGWIGKNSSSMLTREKTRKLNENGNLSRKRGWDMKIV